MQENNGIEAMPTPKYFLTLDKLNKSMVLLSKIKTVCMKIQEQEAPSEYYANEIIKRKSHMRENYNEERKVPEE